MLDHRARRPTDSDRAKAWVCCGIALIFLDEIIKRFQTVILFELLKLQIRFLSQRHPTTQ